MRQPLLIEIGVEELPSSHLKLAVETLKKSFPEALKKARLGFEGLEVRGTPRRLVIHIKELETQQLSQDIQIVGPTKTAALDAEGKPTQSYLGFLRSQKVSEKEVSFHEIPNKKGEYLILEKKIPGQKTKFLLPDLIREQIANIPLTRKMRWEFVEAKHASPLQFSRPIRWLLVFFGDKSIPLTLGSIRSSNVTCGHRLLHPKPVRVKNIKDYFQKIKKFGVVLNPQERQKMIREALSRGEGCLASTNDHFFSERNNLIEEVANLVEIPFFFKGKLSHHFLELPEEVLVASMSKYQRVFALREKNGKLKSSFLAVLNGKPDNMGLVKKHFEWVLNARLVDSLFFFNEDKKIGLGPRIHGLREIKFHEQLGSYYDKSFRLEKLCQTIVEKDMKEEKELLVNVGQAALYSKRDLLTKMVYEFPSLQGTMGRYYVMGESEKDISGDRQKIARAIEEQYFPKGAGQPIPSTIEGAILALADRLDTVVGLFGIGIYPTGSEDPFGLRRAATGIIRILLEKKIPLSIDNLIDRSISSYRSYPNPPSLGNQQELKQKVSEFLRERLAIQLKESFGSTGLVEAVLSSDSDHVVDWLDRLSQLSQVLKEPYFQQAAKVQERTQNIVRAVKGGADHSGVREDLLVEEPEKGLWRAFKVCREQAEPLINKREYQQATKVYGTALFEPIHTFFDRVLVNTENEEIRKNRLKLCNEIYIFYARRVADLSKLRMAVDIRKE